jgi:hypothetical protein
MELSHSHSDEDKNLGNDPDQDFWDYQCENNSGDPYEPYSNHDHRQNQHDTNDDLFASRMQRHAWEQNNEPPSLLSIETNHYKLCKACTKRWEFIDSIMQSVTPERISYASDDIKLIESIIKSVKECSSQYNKPPIKII